VNKSDQNADAGSRSGFFAGASDTFRVEFALFRARLARFPLAARCSPGF
jgi:hypothetical protein